MTEGADIGEIVSAGEEVFLKDPVLVFAGV